MNFTQTKTLSSHYEQRSFTDYETHQQMRNSKQLYLPHYPGWVKEVELHLEDSKTLRHAFESSAVLQALAKSNFSAISQENVMTEIARLRQLEENEP